MNWPKWLRWPWPKKVPQEQIAEAERRLERVIRDDAEVAIIEKTTQKMLRENNLAPYVMRALRAQRR
jgi:hypothetical protein